MHYLHNRQYFCVMVTHYIDSLKTPLYYQRSAVTNITLNIHTNTLGLPQNVQNITT